MNNSLVMQEVTPPENPQEKLRDREALLVRLIEAVQRVMQTQDWSSLKTEVFDGLAERFKSELLSEAKKENPDSNKLNRLAGELKWAEKYADLDKYAETLRVELKGIRLRLHGKSE